MAQVKHIPYTLHLSCFCNSWLEHWQKYGGNPEQSECCVVGCEEKSTVGGHVNNIASHDFEPYIAPFCGDHSRSYQILDVGDTPLVFADVRKTCNKH